MFERWGVQLTFIGTCSPVWNASMFVRERGGVSISSVRQVDLKIRSVKLSCKFDTRGGWGTSVLPR